MSTEYKSFIELGQDFHKARSSHKMTIQKVSDITKIKKSYIEAIENGNISAVPYKTYLLGYVRAYATLLEFDVQSTTDAYKKALAQETEADDSIDKYVKACSSNNTVENLANKLPSKKILVLTILLLLFLGYLSFYYNY